MARRAKRKRREIDIKVQAGPARKVKPVVDRICLILTGSGLGLAGGDAEYLSVLQYLQ